jgi:type VI secretion system protein VasJ
MYVVKALEQKGGIYLQAAEDIKYHLSKLIKRIPDLVQMKFRDKQTPFAEAETIRWIDEEVKKTESAGQSNVAAALPPIMGEEYEEINKMYESAVSVLPEKFEENLDLMQQSISRDVRIKGRFLRKLNLANYCINAKQFSLAKVYLTELKMNIDRLNISGWEPALCTAVW